MTENKKAFAVHLTSQNIKDLLAGLDMRLAALADARPGFRSPMRRLVNEKAEELSALVATLKWANEEIEKQS